MPTKLDEAWGDEQPTKTTALDDAWGAEPATPSAVEGAAPAPVAAKQPAPDTTHVPKHEGSLTHPTPQLANGAPQVIIDPARSWQPTSPTAPSQLAAAAEEDARRVKKFATETVPSALSSAWDAQAQVGGFIADAFDPNSESAKLDPKWAKPYGKGSSAYELDSFLERDPLSQLQAIGHGIAPETIDAPPDAPAPTTNLVGGLSALKDAAFSPAVAGVQSLQEHVGAPVANAVLSPMEQPGQPHNRVGDLAQLAARQAASFIGGEKAGPNPEAGYATRTADDPLAVPAMVGGEIVKQVPFFLFTSGVGARAVAGEKASILDAAKLTQPEATARALAPVLSKEAAVEGLAQAGIFTAMTPGQDVVTGPAFMAITGALAGRAASGEMAQRAVMEHHAVAMPAQSWEQFTKDVFDLSEKVKPVARTPYGERAKNLPQYATGGMSPTTTKLVMDTATGQVRPRADVQVTRTKGDLYTPKKEANANFDPTMAVYARNERGTLVGREVQVVFPETGGVDLTFRDTELRTGSDVKRWQKERVGAKGVSLNGTWAEGVAFDAQARGAAELPFAGTEPGTKLGESPSMPPEVMSQDPRLANKVAVVQERQAMVANDPAMKARLEAQTTPGKRAQGLPVVAAVNKEGVLKVVPVADPAPKPQGTWKLVKGDLVNAPDGTPYIVQGFRPDGKVLAKMPGAKGRPKAWDNASLHFVADSEGNSLESFTPARIKGVGIPDATARPIHPMVGDIIDEMGKVTVPRLARSLKVNLGEAASIIDHYHGEGRLMHTTEPGVYETTRVPPLPENLRNEPWGELPMEAHDPWDTTSGPRDDTGKLVPLQSRAMGPAKPPPAPVLRGHNQPVDYGMEVYLASDMKGVPVKGVVRGPDPDNAGHYLLDVYSRSLLEDMQNRNALQSTKWQGKTVQGIGGNNLRTVSIPMKDLYTTVPVNLAKPALTKLFKNRYLYGLTTPHPPDFVVADKQFQSDVDNAVRIAQASRVPEGLVKRKEALMGQLLNAYYRTPVALRRKAAMLYAAWPAARDAALRISERVKEASGGYGNQYDKDLIAVLEAAHSQGNADDALKDWVFKNPHAASSMDTLRDLMAERKANSQWMADNGLASIDWLEQARDAGEEAEYLTMMYNVDLLKGKYNEWVKKNVPHVWEGAVDELTRGGRNAWEVENELAGIMRQKDALGALAESSLVDNAAFKKLLARGEWQKKYPKIAALMGPVPSGSLRLGHSIGYQRAIKAQVNTWNSIRDSQWWSPAPRGDLTLPIPNEPRFGKAAGGYTHESLANFVTKKPADDAGSIARMFGYMGGKWKSFNTVYGGPVPWVNNVLRNLKGVAISGGYQGPEDMEGFKRAPSMLMGWRENPSMLGPYAIVGEAKQYGALSAGFAGAEIYDARRRIQDELLRAMSRAAGNASTMEEMVMAAQDFMRTKAENVKDAYDAIDQYFKLASYLNLRKRYVGKGFNIHDAAAVATEDINAGYPNFEMPSPLVAKARGKFGWVAPFLSSKAEDLRINALLAGRIARGDPGLSLRMAAFGAGVGGAVGLMRGLARSNGITSQDEQDAVNNLTLKRQSWSPMLVPMWDYDNQGRIQFIDLTPIEDTFMMLRGSPNDPVAARIFLNNIQDVIGSDSYFGRAAQAGMNSAGLITEAPDQPTPIPFGEGSPLGLLGEYARSGGVPQAPMRMYDAWARTQPNDMNPAAEPWTPAQAGARMMGLPVAGPSGVGTAIGSLREAKGAVRGLKHEAKAIPRRLGQDPDPARADYLLNSKMRGLGTVQDRIQSIRVPQTLSPPATASPRKPGTGGSK